MITLNLKSTLLFCTVLTMQYFNEYIYLFVYYLYPHSQHQQASACGTESAAMRAAVQTLIVPTMVHPTLCQRNMLQNLDLPVRNLWRNMVSCLLLIKTE